eukprot:Gregarina_sp_Poly_1__5408@NODE_285_length_10045_cov_61_806174_g246_i0_p1_GENE_NODE_285_length_10045_cov_61_806174_g246_i0NODE_285_length_10045_cov_61_806174_g246_i0_p1_ORF_typecomplete_len758_score145_58Topoisom_I/PF01028_20/1_5e78Topoisom_I/PF01028_20/4_6e03Topoisom_I_N/PF02919_15/4_2e74Topo_C_assoc/PF14370_6/9_6e03Topo_C_assoc/PF14370_6/1_4e24_NODE_285_length_10045_cov_61_806174_g246_i038716144
MRHAVLPNDSSDDDDAALFVPRVQGEGDGDACATQPVTPEQSVTVRKRALAALKTVSASVVRQAAPKRKNGARSAVSKNAPKKDLPGSDDDDEPLVPNAKAKKAPAKAESKVETVKKEPRSPSGKGSPAKKRKHVLTEEHFEPINTWWDKPLREKYDPQWRYLEHHGLMFHPSYTTHGVPLIYNGHEVHLPPQAEEVANFWCAAQTSDYPEKVKFVCNFWEAFVNSLPATHPLRKGALETARPGWVAPTPTGPTPNSSLGPPYFQLADFSRIREHLETTKEREKEHRRQLTKEEREEDRRKRLKVEGPHMYALHDDIREKVASYKAEVPGLFRGRGEHPKMGKLKRRIFPDEVVLNLAEDAPVPRLPPWLAGHAWQDVYHDASVTWLAFYRDSVNNSFKYIFLGASSAVKGAKDFLKYELARRLKNYVSQIRQDYTAKMQSHEISEQQLGTAAYVIDRLALRVGNEKDREEEADTVGCCSLRVEHVTGWNDDTHQITLDFLGKDSIRYLNTVELDPLAYKNIKQFCQLKSSEENIFDTTSTSSLNKYLKELMPGLSAKVFRTYNASVTLQSELSHIDDPEHAVDKSSVEDIKRFYEHANRQVAILCNHQRSVPKQHDVSMGKLQKALNFVLENIQEVEEYIQWLRDDNSSGDFKFTPSPRAPEDPPHVPAVKPNMKEEAAVRKLHTLKNKKVKMELRIRVKDENKTVSNHTSKQHYMDPRITVTFCKKYDLPIEKFFNSSLLKKFPWAMYAKSDFVW